MINAITARIAARFADFGSGFFIRYDYARSVDKAVPTYPEVETLFDECHGDFSALISEFGTTLPDLRSAISEGAIPFERVGMFPPLDVLAAYHFVRTYRPERIIEIGSGASSHVLARALSDNKFGELTCIDPEPRRSIEKIGAKIEKRVLNIDDVKLVEGLAPNDILFIDSSHILLPGMDVDIQFNRMFPRLPVGTIVHLHDIFLPDDYPQHWYGRYYSEQNALIGWLLSGYFEVLYPSYYVASRLGKELEDVVGDFMPNRPRPNTGSIWLRRRAPGG